MKFYNVCEFCEGEGPDVELYPFRSVLTYLCSNCVQQIIDKANGVSRHDRIEYGTQLTIFPPVAPSAIQQPNKNQDGKTTRKK